MMKNTKPLLIFISTIVNLWAANALAIETIDGMRILRSADVHPEDFPTVQAVQYIHQQIQKESGKKLGIRVFASGLLGDEKELLQLVQSGELDMNRVSIQALDSISPLARVFSLPYIFRDTDHMHKVIDGSIGQEILDSLARHGLIGLAFYDAGTRNVYTLNKPIMTLEDFKGLKIRVQPSEISTMVFRQLGAEPVSMAYSHVNRALSNALVEAAENNITAYNSSGHYKHAPYFSLTGITMSPEILVMSRITWNKLTPKEQTMLRRIARDSVLFMRKIWQQREDNVKASLKHDGVKIIEPSQEQMARFAAATRPVFSRFANDPQQQHLIRQIQSLK